MLKDGFLVPIISLAYFHLNTKHLDQISPRLITHVLIRTQVLMETVEHGVPPKKMKQAILQSAAGEAVLVVVTSRRNAFSQDVRKRFL